MLEALFQKHSNSAKPSKKTNISLTTIVLVIIAFLLIDTRSKARVNAFMPKRSCSPKSIRQSSIPPSSSTRIRESALDRFTKPKIDDPRLPLTEAGLAQIVAPSLELFWLRSLNAPFPSWANPIYDFTFLPRGAALAPTLIHGAGLACCWLLGCLAVKGYERATFEADLPQVLLSTAKAGAFACGVLLIGTQIDLYQEMGGYVQVGDSPETDLRIYRAFVEIINDIFFEAGTLLAWRALRSSI